MQGFERELPAVYDLDRLSSNTRAGQVRPDVFWAAAWGPARGPMDFPRRARKGAGPPFVFVKPALRNSKMDFFFLVFSKNHRNEFLKGNGLMPVRF